MRPAPGDAGWRRRHGRGPARHRVDDPPPRDRRDQLGPGPGAVHRRIRHGAGVRPVLRHRARRGGRPRGRVRERSRERRRAVRQRVRRGRPGHPVLRPGHQPRSQRRRGPGVHHHRRHAGSGLGHRLLDAQDSPRRSAGLTGPRQSPGPVPRDPGTLSCRVTEMIVSFKTPAGPRVQSVIMEQRISLVTLGVTDLARARAFYEALGWKGAQQPDDEVCFYQAGGMVFGLWAALGGHGAPGIEIAHNVRSPEEVSALLTEAERAGGSIVRPAARTDWGGTSGAFADPDGYVWEVAHNPGWTLDQDGAVHI